MPADLSIIDLYHFPYKTDDLPIFVNPPGEEEDPEHIPHKYRQDNVYNAKQFTEYFGSVLRRIDSRWWIKYSPFFARVTEPEGPSDDKQFNRPPMGYYIPHDPYPSHNHIEWWGGNTIKLEDSFEMIKDYSNIIDNMEENDWGAYGTKEFGPPSVYIDHEGHEEIDDIWEPIEALSGDHRHTMLMLEADDAPSPRSGMQGMLWAMWHYVNFLLTHPIRQSVINDYLLMAIAKPLRDNFLDIDEDDLGYITFEQAQGFIDYIQQSEFNELDDNDDGELTIGELDEFIKSRMRTITDLIWMNWEDCAENDELTFQQAKSATNNIITQAQFDEIDLDSDGKIQLDEFLEYLEENGEPMDWWFADPRKFTHYDEDIYPYFEKEDEGEDPEIVLLTEKDVSVTELVKLEPLDEFSDLMKRPDDVSSLSFNFGMGYRADAFRNSSLWGKTISIINKQLDLMEFYFREPENWVLLELGHIKDDWNLKTKSILLQDRVNANIPNIIEEHQPDNYVRYPSSFILSDWDHFIPNGYHPGGLSYLEGGTQDGGYQSYPAVFWPLEPNNTQPYRGTPTSWTDPIYWWRFMPNAGTEHRILHLNQRPPLTSGQEGSFYDYALPVKRVVNDENEFWKHRYHHLRWASFVSEPLYYRPIFTTNQGGTIISGIAEVSENLYWRFQRNTWNNMEHICRFGWCINANLDTSGNSPAYVTLAPDFQDHHISGFYHRVSWPSDTYPRANTFGDNSRQDSRVVHILPFGMTYVSAPVPANDHRLRDIDFGQFSNRWFINIQTITYMDNPSLLVDEDYPTEVNKRLSMGLELRENWQRTFDGSGNIHMRLRWGGKYYIGNNMQYLTDYTYSTEWMLDRGDGSNMPWLPEYINDSTGRINWNTQNGVTLFRELLIGQYNETDYPTPPWKPIPSTDPLDRGKLSPHQPLQHVMRGSPIDWANTVTYAETWAKLYIRHYDEEFLDGLFENNTIKVTAKVVIEMNFGNIKIQTPIEFQNNNPQSRFRGSYGRIIVPPPDYLIDTEATVRWELGESTGDIHEDGDIVCLRPDNMDHFHVWEPAKKIMEWGQEVWEAQTEYETTLHNYVNANDIYVDYTTPLYLLLGDKVNVSWEIWSFSENDWIEQTTTAEVRHISGFPTVLRLENLGQQEFPDPDTIQIKNNKFNLTLISLGLSKQQIIDGHGEWELWPDLTQEQFDDLLDIGTFTGIGGSEDRVNWSTLRSFFSNKFDDYNIYESDEFEIILDQKEPVWEHFEAELMSVEKAYIGSGFSSHLMEYRNVERDENGDIIEDYTERVWVWTSSAYGEFDFDEVFNNTAGCTIFNLDSNIYNHGERITLDWGRQPLSYVHPNLDQHFRGREITSSNTDLTYEADLVYQSDEYHTRPINFRVKTEVTNIEVIPNE